MKRFLYIFICCFYGPVLSQEAVPRLSFENAPLVEILQTLETQYDVRFSYLDHLLSDRRANLGIDPSRNLSEPLAALQEQTALKFEIVDPSHVVIRAFHSKDVIDGCGYLLDQERHPVQDASIVITGQKQPLVTDKKGFFEFKNIRYNTPIALIIPGVDTLRTKAKAFIARDCIFFYGKSGFRKVERLTPIVIDDYLTKGILKKEHKMVMKTQALGILPGLVEPDILQSIQLAPGVSSPFETASGLYVRGGTPGQNLVLWNGIKTYNQGHLFGMLSTFNPYVTKEVDFIKSGTHAQYGNSVSGVIAIKTDDQIATKSKGGLGMNMINADVHVTTPIVKEKSALQISGRRSFTDLVQSPTYNQLAKRVFQNTKIANPSTTHDQSKNNFYFVDYNLNSVAQIGKGGHLIVNALYNKNDLDYSIRSSNSTYQDLLTTENEGYRLEWKPHKSQKTALQVAAYYSKYKMDYQFITRQNNSDIQTETKKNIVQDYGTSLQLDHQYNSKTKIAAGYQYTRHDVRYAFETLTPSYILTLDQDDNHLDAHAAYTVFEYHHPSKLKTSLGLRGNYYAQLEQTHIEPRFYIKKYFGTHWSISGSGEYRSQIVSQIKESVLSDLNLENQIWTLANPSKFPPITSYQYTIGGTYSQNNWFVDLDTYYKKISNLTTLTAGFLYPVDNNFNTGNSTIMGMDFFVKKRFANYNSWISYSYINAKNQFGNLNQGAAFRGNTVIEHSIRWSHFYTHKNFKCTLGWLWHTGKSYTEIADNPTNGLNVLKFNGINEANLPLYHRLDFSSSYDFKFQSNADIGYRIGLSILNLYNHKNVLNREYRITNTLPPEVTKNQLYTLGITPNLSVRMFW